MLVKGLENNTYEEQLREQEFTLRRGGRGEETSLLSTTA